MKNKGWSFTWTAVLLLCSALLVSACPSSASVREQELKTVRVGFFAFDGYHMLDKDGSPSGYGYELLQHMLGYTNWKYEYVGYGKGWGEMQDMLARGEIDLLTSAQKTPERMERFDFSDKSIGTSAVLLTVKAGNNKYAPGKYSGWNGMRVGMIEGSSRNADFAAFAAEHGFTYVPVYFKNTRTLAVAMKSEGSVDAIVTSNLRSIDGEWVLARFATSPFYIMVKKGDHRLLGEVNRALENLYDDEAGLRTQLMDKYYAPDDGDEIPFTPEGRAFIKAAADTEFTAVINPDRAPYSYYAGGRPEGILKDIADEIIRRSGLRVKFIETKNRMEYADLLDSGGADIVFDAWNNYQNAEKRGYRLTRPYLRLSVSRLYNKGNDGRRSVALVKGMDLIASHAGYFTKKYGRNRQYYDTIKQAVAAVSAGRQDMTYLYSGSAELAVQTDVTNRLAAETVFGYNNSFAVGVKAGRNRLLFSVLNKTVSSLKDEEIAAIVQRHTAYKQKPFSIIGYMYDEPVAIVGAVLFFSFFAGLLLLVAFMAKERRREQEQLAEEQEHAEQLACALESAQKATAAKSQFLSHMSHEIRTPMNAIVGLTEIARQHKDDAEKMDEYLRKIGVSSKMLLHIINDILDMSAIESGKLKIANSAFDIKQVLTAISAVYYPHCANKGVDFVMEIDLETETFGGDSLRVEQILLNLVSNAHKFTPRGGRIAVRVEEKAHNDTTVFLRFTVSDSGCGMSEEMKERLFKPFEQASAETAREHGGSGLGLSIVKNLIDMMHGAISVKSEPGVGTTMIVDLPFERVQQDSHVSGETLRKLRVLVVDDDQSALEYTSIVLRRIGVSFDTAGSGEEALEMLDAAAAEGKAYNVCLIDWKMKGMDGIELTRRVRARQDERAIIIIVSAYDLNDVTEEAREAGADQMVSKPLFQSTVFNALMTLANGKLLSEGEKHEKYDFTGRRALLAEDQELNAEIAMELLALVNLKTDRVCNGREAVERFLGSEPGTYDVVLMDIQMPVMDGYGAARAIRAADRPDAAEIPILAMTANAFTEDVTAALSAGMNGHIAKPIDTGVLYATLAAAMH